jgi:UDP:flavonoid glycosyltransferase YjiC (YdhE family)
LEVTTICCFANCAYLSETSRMIAVYRQLVTRGADAVFATHGGTYEQLLHDHGIPFELVPPHMSHERAQRYVAANRGDAGMGQFFRFYESNEELRAHVQGEVDFFHAHAVDLVLTGWALSTALSTRVAGIPLATTHMGSYVPPAAGKVGVPGAQWLERIVPESWRRDFYNWALDRGISVRSYNEVARGFGIPPFGGAMDLLMGDLTLVTDVPEVLGVAKEVMEAWTPGRSRRFSCAPRLRYVGAIFAKLFGELPDDVKAFLDTNAPKVYVALTSSRSDYVASCYRVLRQLDVRAVFVSTVHTEAFEPAEHILVRPHLPSHQVMPLVDCTIIHGGQGSVQTAISSGTPIVGFPLQGEQYLNLHLIERHGAGRNLPLRALRRGRFRKVLEQVLADRSYKTNMQRLQAWQAAADGAANVAHILCEEAALESRSRRA